VVKQTFYNLSEEKRNRIIDAVMKEFSSSSTEKVSINRIIKSADISRGSFYQYFDDKVDLVEILVKSFADISLEKINSALKVSNGDIFDTYISLFEAITELSKDKKQNKVLKNLFKNLKANDDLISDYLVNRFEGFAHIRDVINSFNRDNLKFKDEKDVEHLSHILTQILKNAIFNVYVNGNEINQVKTDFKRKIEIIKQGAVIDSKNQG
jgi:AcrR family transcriptional regulator